MAGENKVLKDLYSYYVTEVRYSEEAQGSTHSIAESQLVDLLGKVLEGKEKNNAENFLATTTADHELQGFIDGFRYATEIWKAC